MLAVEAVDNECKIKTKDIGFCLSLVRVWVRGPSWSFQTTIQHRREVDTRHVHGASGPLVRAPRLLKRGGWRDRYGVSPE